MYLDSQDFQTVWYLAHNWCDADPEITDENNLPGNLKITIQRIMNAIMWNHLRVRTRRWRIFTDESILTFILNFSHYRKFNQCLRGNVFNKAYLNSLYVKRPEVLAWCQKDFLAAPPIWGLEKNLDVENKYDTSDDENEGWYNDLTERRKQRVACLELAKKLWLIYPDKSYEQIYNDPTMKRFGNPNVFSLDAFKKWARPFAPEQIKEGGRPSKIK